MSKGSKVTGNEAAQGKSKSTSIRNKNKNDINKSSKKSNKKTTKSKFSDDYQVEFTDGKVYNLLEFDPSTDMPKSKVPKSERDFSDNLRTSSVLSEEESEYESSSEDIDTISGKRYNLSDSDIRKLAIACIQENGGSERAIKGEASLMCNLYQKRGSKYSNVLDYVLYGGWFGVATRSAVRNNRHHPSSSQISWVKDVVVNGNRTIPLKVNEHDCYSDISWIKNSGIKHTSHSYISNPKNYHKDKTVIHNRYGSTYTFYCFMRNDNSGDPYGYTGS